MADDSPKPPARRALRVPTTGGSPSTLNYAAGTRPSQTAQRRREDAWRHAPAFRMPIAILKPSPTRPSMLPTGTLVPSKKISAVLLPARRTNARCARLQQRQRTRGWGYQRGLHRVVCVPCVCVWVCVQVCQRTSDAHLLLGGPVRQPSEAPLHDEAAVGGATHRARSLRSPCWRARARSRACLVATGVPRLTRPCDRVSRPSSRRQPPSWQTR